jgi:hypothetical protein
LVVSGAFERATHDSTVENCTVFSCLRLSFFTEKKVDAGRQWYFLYSENGEVSPVRRFLLVEFQQILSNRDWSILLIEEILRSVTGRPSNNVKLTWDQVSMIDKCRKREEPRG